MNLSLDYKIMATLCVLGLSVMSLFAGVVLPPRYFTKIFNALIDSVMFSYLIYFIWVLSGAKIP